MAREAGCRTSNGLAVEHTLLVAMRGECGVTGLVIAARSRACLRASSTAAIEIGWPGRSLGNSQALGHALRQQARGMSKSPGASMTQRFFPFARRHADHHALAVDGVRRTAWDTRSPAA